jgi:N-methylhydantoinase A
MMSEHPSEKPWRIGVDVGGTFTDGLALNERTGATAQVKVLSTPEDPSKAFLTTVSRLLQAVGIEGHGVSHVVHGTTVATNAVLQQQLADTVLVTTKGFRDLLEIARQVRPDPYDVFAEKPKRLVPRDLCFEVDERIAADGSVVKELDERSIDRLVRDLHAVDPTSIAICLLHAYRNPAHERRVADALKQAFPTAAISISSELASEFREYPRACTTIINAGLMPLVSGYLSRIDQALQATGAAGTRLVMQSNGGAADFAQSAERPVFLIESGPAAGVVAAAHVARTLDYPNVISFDMGGTTAKAGLVQGATPQQVQEFEIGVTENRSRNWFPGASGYPILTPAVDLVEIGTGGGSIAWVDNGGRLRVGPRSAGADPGPACYGKQAEIPTITDANLLLGRLNPDYFLGGDMRLDVGASRTAISRVAAQIGLDPLQTAAGIIRIADTAMSHALRVVSVQRGYEPSEFKLVAFGGAGPLHAAALAAEVGIPEVVVPLRPGLASAFGLLVSDIRHDFSRTLVCRLDDADVAALNGVFDELAQKARAVLAAENIPYERAEFTRLVDVRYVGQSYYLTLPLEGSIHRQALEGIRARFNEMHRVTYGYAELKEPCELVNLRIAAVGRIDKPRVVTRAAAEVPAGKRQVYFADMGFLECAVIRRGILQESARVQGPAVIEEVDATTLIPPGWSAVVVPGGSLLITRGGGGRLEDRTMIKAT